MYKAAIFDMDGTILDTLSDLCNAINYSFEKAGHKHDFTIDETKTLFGSGVDVAIKRGLAMEMGFTEDDLLSIGTDHECSKIKTDSSELNEFCFYNNQIFLMNALAIEVWFSFRILLCNLILCYFYCVFF